MCPTTITRLRNRSLSLCCNDFGSSLKIFHVTSLSDEGSFNWGYVAS